jgi:HEAT repeat protein
MGAVNAFWALGNRAEGAGEELNRIVLQDGDGIAGERAADCLSGIGMRGVRLLLANLDDPNPSVRYNSARNIDRVCRVYRTELADAIPTLLGHLTDTNNVVAIQVTSVLTGLNTESELLVPALLTNLARASAPVRIATLEAFCTIDIPEKSVVPLLRPLLADPVFDVRYLATNALRRIEPEFFTNPPLK